MAIPDELLKTLVTLVAERDWGGLRENARLVHPHDLAEFILGLDGRVQKKLMANLGEELLVEVVPELPEEKQREVIEFTPPTSGARLLERLPPDETADILESLTPEKRLRLFEHLPEEKKSEIRELLKYPPESAGGLMTTELLALDQKTTVKDALEYIRREAKEYEVIYYIYVTDSKNRLAGVVSLRDLVLAPLDKNLKGIMEPKAIKVYAHMDQEKVAEVMADYNLTAVPVVDKRSVLLGIVTIDDVVDVIHKEATEDITLMGAVQPLEESYLTSPTLSLFRRRITWLILLFVGETSSMAILRLYQHALSAIVALTFFIPLIIDTAGNAGSQSATLVIRSFAIGESGEKDFLRIFLKELRTGLLLGMGVAAFSLPWSRFVGDVSILIGLTVSISLIVVTTISTCIGGALPILAKKAGVDPAIISAPLLTTVVDSIGLLTYFLVAKQMLGF